MPCSIKKDEVTKKAPVLRSLRYGLLSQTAPCRTWASQFYAENDQNFREGSSTWITTPSSGGQNQFLAPDARLCFSVTNTSEQIITLDGTTCSALSKPEAYCGSNLLVSAQEHGALFSMLYMTSRLLRRTDPRRANYWVFQTQLEWATSYHRNPQDPGASYPRNLRGPGLVTPGISSEKPPCFARCLGALHV